jgi:hypothetical protein
VLQRAVVLSKRIEDVRQEFGPDAAAGVRDRHLRVTPDEGCPHRNMAAFRREFNGIREQIRKHLLKANRITDDHDVFS